jgi:deoxyribose-phosphate aldolase
MELNKYIDHTLLKPEATKEQIKALCKEAKDNNFAAVCVNPYYVAIAAKELFGTEVKTCTVVGFPLGATPTESKLGETHKALEDGAQEVDMVINIGALKDKDDEYVQNDIKALAEACHDKSAILKVIFETCLLNDEEIERASKLSLAAGADYIKTSTGFSSGGATIEAVKIMRSVDPEIGVKASGGVRSKEDALKMIEAGATRIGTSSGVKIVAGETVEGGY